MKQAARCCVVSNPPAAQRDGELLLGPYRAARYIDGDFVLGADGDFFLDVSCDRFLVWINSTCAEERLVWTRGTSDTKATWKATFYSRDASHALR